MPDLHHSMIAAQRIICIKKYLAPRVAGRKFILQFYLKKVGGKFLFQCNFDFSKLSLTLPDFYRECILTWSSLNYNNPSSYTEISNQFLWNNKCICIKSRSDIVFSFLTISKKMCLFQRKWAYLVADILLLMSFLHLELVLRRLLVRYTNAHPPAIDLYSLYVLLPHFRPRDGTLENHCFQILKY